MKFNEAMEHLLLGEKVTRQPWHGSLYFKLDGKEVKSYQPKIGPYIYNEDIMISDGWIISDREGTYKFYDMIPYLKIGHTAHLKDWKEMYIYFDVSTASLILYSMEILQFIPNVDSFLAKDWMTI